MWAAEWNEVVFTDESRICLQHHDGRIRIWRHREERMLDSCVMHHYTGPAPGYMVWGGIGYHSRTPLVRIAGLREAGWSNRRIGRHLGRSDMVVARCWSGSQKVECTVAEGSSVEFLPTTSVTDWRRVIFSDESRFSLSDDDHRTRERRTGQRSDPAFIVERHTAISQGVTVWGAISLGDTRSSLVVLQGTLTARRYVDDILTPIVLPMLSSRPGAIYQQDNARPHTARLSQQCLQEYDVLPWPARSPDLSPIEHVWTRWEGNSRPEIQEN
ncbi:transposable element Tc1 transposase [Trichonephila clavipes]|nr:transposable element Tc1 transposase [Trichonephila clavipes]